MFPLYIAAGCMVLAARYVGLKSCRETNAKTVYARKGYNRQYRIGSRNL
jgi:hypothetical protein